MLGTLSTLSGATHKANEEQSAEPAQSGPTNQVEILTGSHIASGCRGYVTHELAENVESS